MARSTTKTKKKAATKKKAKPKKKATAKKKAAPKKKAVPKRKVKAKVVPKKRFAALSEERTHKLTRAQLLKWRTLFAEMQNSGTKVELSRMKRDAAEQRFLTVARSVPKVKVLLEDFESLQASLEVQTDAYKERRKEHNQYVNAVAEKLGLGGKRISIDDATGIVREIDGSG